MRKISTIASAVMVAGCLSLGAAPVHASLIFSAAENFQGTGLGAVNTILTIQSPQNSSTETGAVSWNGAADQITGNIALTGSSQTQTRTISQLGLTSAASLRVVFNALEPGGATNNIDLTNLVLHAPLNSHQGLEAGVLLIDLLVFGAFVSIALFSQRFWPLWVAGLQLTSLLAHLARVSRIELLPVAYAAAERFWSYPILIIIAVGAWREHKRLSVGRGLALPA